VHFKKFEGQKTGYQNRLKAAMNDQHYEEGSICLLLLIFVKYHILGTSLFQTDLCSMGLMFKRCRWPL